MFSTSLPSLSPQHPPHPPGQDGPAWSDRRSGCAPKRRRPRGKGQRKEDQHIAPGADRTLTLQLLHNAALSYTHSGSPGANQHAVHQEEKQAFIQQVPLDLFHSILISSIYISFFTIAFHYDHNETFDYIKYPVK